MAEKQITVDRDTFIRFNAAALQACIFLFKKYGQNDNERRHDECWDKTYEIYTEPSFKLDENLEGYFDDPKREAEIMGVETCQQ